MRYYLSIPILAIAVVLQASLLPDVRLLNAQPDLMLLIVIAWSVYAEREEAIVWAFAGGIMQDLLSPLPTGTSIVAPLIVIFGIKAMSEQVFRFGLLLLLGFVILGTLVHHFFVLTVLGVNGFSYDPLLVVQTILIPTLFLNIVGIFPVYVLVRLVQNRLPRRRISI